jgi:hypothetical protein
MALVCVCVLSCVCAASSPFVAPLRLVVDILEDDDACTHHHDIHTLHLAIYDDV